MADALNMVVQIRGLPKLEALVRRLEQLAPEVKTALRERMAGVDDYRGGFRFDVSDGVAAFEFIYPRNNSSDKPQHLQVGLEETRAADAIRIRYDFERDGWVVEQQVWTDEDRTGEVWREAAFCQAWQFDTERED